MKLEKRDKPKGRKLKATAMKELKTMLKAKGKDPDKHNWSKAKTDVDLADELRRFCNAL